MSPDETNHLISIEHRLTNVEAELKGVNQQLADLCEARKTWINRAWGIVKGVILLIVGYGLAHLKQ